MAALDGVRGLAVIAVVLFHVDLARGGWVGVDVFFVLSGFLITTLLLAERRGTGRVGLRAFWSRRVRRLAPALLVVVGAVSIVWAVADRVVGSLRGDVLATLGYVANWHFIRDGESYFASFDPSPLRHAWSLAIEEQFYVVWPVVFVVLVRLRPALRIGLVALAAATSTWWIRAVSADPDALSRAYYGSDTRSATILVGCLAALVVDAQRARDGGGVVDAMLRKSSGAAAVGACAFLLAVVVCVPTDSVWLYRAGGFTLIAAVAGILVVAAAHLPPGAVRRVLAGPLLVRAGLISYALYLWHWPVVVVLDRTALPRGQLVVLQLAVSVLLAEMTYRIVERPIRRSHLRHPAFTVVGSVATVVAVTVVATATSGAAMLVPQAVSGTVVAGPPSVVATAPATTTTAPTIAPTTEAPVVTVVATTTTTSTTTATLPPPPPLELPLDVVVLGDSVAWKVASAPPADVPFAVRGAWHAECDIIGQRIHVGDHVDKEDRDCLDRPAEWSAALERPADVVVVVLGLRQLFDLDADGQRVPLGSPLWEEHYRTAVRDALFTIRVRTSAPVLWFDVACYTWGAAGTAGEEHDPERMRIVNAVLRNELAGDSRVTVVDYGLRVCDGAMPIAALRPDGVHLAPTAVHDVWYWLAPQILQAASDAR